MSFTPANGVHKGGVKTVRGRDRITLSAHDRQLRALALRRTGATYQAIANTLGYSHPSGAYKAIKTALRVTLKEAADEVRDLEVARLDEALFAIWRRVTAGDDGAILSMIRIMKRRAQLLGLDAPTKREVTAEIALRSYTEVAAERYGLNPAEVLAEAERILAEVIEDEAR